MHIIVEILIANFERFKLYAEMLGKQYRNVATFQASKSKTVFILRVRIRIYKSSSVFLCFFFLNVIRIKILDL